MKNRKGKVMNKCLLAILSMNLLGCGANNDGTGLSVIVSGVYLESSDGKYIGELVGMADPYEYRWRNCAYVYNPEINGIFGVELDAADACNAFMIEFSGSNCEFDTTVVTSMPITSMWLAVEPGSGDVYAASSEVTSGTIGSRLHYQSGECQPRDTPETFDTKHVIYESTGDRIDFGSAPVQIKTRERN